MFALFLFTIYKKNVKPNKNRKKDMKNYKKNKKN